MALFAWDFGLPDLDQAVREALGDNSNLNASERTNLVEAVNYLDQSYIIHTVIVVITLLVSLILLLLTLSRVYEINKYGRYARKNALAVSYKVDNIVWKMLCADVFAIAAASVVVLTYSHTVDSDDAYCEVMWKMCILFYMILNHCCYFVMIYRAKAVVDSTIFAGYRKLRKLVRFVEMANYSFFLVYPLPFFTMGYISLPPSKICMYYSSPAIAVFVVIADTMFSLLLLSLFVIPLIFIAEQSEKDMANSPATATIVQPAQGEQHSRNSHIFRNLIKRQCFLSAMAISSTFTAAVVMMLVNNLAGPPTLDNVASQAWRSWGSCLFHTDILINMVSIHLICQQSMPMWIRSKTNLSERNKTTEAVKRYNTADSSRHSKMWAVNNQKMNFEIEMPQSSSV